MALMCIAVSYMALIIISKRWKGKNISKIEQIRIWRLEEAAASKAFTKLLAVQVEVNQQRLLCGWQRSCELEVCPRRETDQNRTPIFLFQEGEAEAPPLRTRVDDVWAECGERARRDRVGVTARRVILFIKGDNPAAILDGFIDEVEVIPWGGRHESERSVRVHFECGKGDIHSGCDRWRIDTK